jgi:hypothetical protein
MLCPMSALILTIPELTLEPSGALTGSGVMDYQSRTVQEHAIRVTEGVAEPTTLCGEFVHGQLLDVAFESTQPARRCVRCAELAGLPHAKN